MKNKKTFLFFLFLFSFAFVFQNAIAHTIPSGTPIDGKCGWLDGMFSYTNPLFDPSITAIASTGQISEHGACEEGGRSNIISGNPVDSSLGPWLWTCVSYNGGATVNCSTLWPNNCAAETCSTEKCFDDMSWVTGTKICDNGCATDTCSSDECWNGLEWVDGAKTCVVLPNSCAQRTCSDKTCWNNIAWVAGVKDCSAPVANGCPDDTCSIHQCFDPVSDGWLNGTMDCTLVEGICGYPNGESVSSLSDGSCLTGRYDNFSGSGPWTWSCLGSYGGLNVDCFANKLTDNGCASSTCNSTSCWNNLAWVQGTKICADDSCAATTCTTDVCWNNLSWIYGTKPCDNGCAVNTYVNETCFNGIIMVNGTKPIPDNGCAIDTCDTTTCWNNLAWVQGTKVCADNSCAADTCPTGVCWNNLAWISGTKPPVYGPNICVSSTACGPNDCGKNIPKIFTCSQDDISGCGGVQIACDSSSCPIEAVQCSDCPMVTDSWKEISP